MGFPRLPKDKQISLTPTLLEAIENKPAAHQDGFVFYVVNLLSLFYIKNIYIINKYILYF